MKKVNSIPVGYKQTKLGLIPKEWNEGKVSDFIIDRKGAIKIGPFGSQLKKETFASLGYKVYGQENIFENDMTFGNRFITSEHFDRLKSCELHPGDFIISMMGTIGKSMVVPEDMEPGIMDSHLLRLKLDNAIIDSRFLSQLFISPLIQKQAKRLSVGGIMDGLSSTIVKQIHFSIPPLPEQQKIAEILNSWDQAIATTQKLIGELKLRNKGLAQQLLTGKKRLKGFEGDWKVYKISDLFQFVNRHILWDDNHSYNLVSIRRRHGGLFFRGTFEAKEIKVKKLKRIETNDFLISKRQVSHGAWAIVPNRYDSHLVSDEYDCLAIKYKDKLDSNFWTFYCQLPRLTHYAFLDSIGVHIEKLIFHYRQFKKRVVRIPELKEQLAITSVLTEADKELKLYQQKLATLKVQKKGLMQKLLTGEIRTI